MKRSICVKIMLCMVCLINESSYNNSSVNLKYYVYAGS